jgi:hypothetical protein
MIGSPIDGLDAAIAGIDILRRITSFLIATCIPSSDCWRVGRQALLVSVRWTKMAPRMVSEAAFVVDLVKAGPRRAPTCTRRRAPTAGLEYASVIT